MKRASFVEQRIVIIDDDPDFVSIVTDTLEHEPYHLEVHPTGKGARQFVKRVEPDLVILDIHLGDRSGWDVFQELRLDPVTEAVPILVCSGSAREVRWAARQMWQWDADVLPKPFTLEELLMKIRQLLPRQDEPRPWTIVE